METIFISTTLLAAAIVSSVLSFWEICFPHHSKGFGWRLTYGLGTGLVILLLGGLSAGLMYLCDDMSSRYNNQISDLRLEKEGLTKDVERLERWLGEEREATKTWFTAFADACRDENEQTEECEAEARAETEAQFETNAQAMEQIQHCADHLSSLSK